jgi:hypothetical protein
MAYRADADEGYDYDDVEHVGTNRSKTTNANYLVPSGPAKIDTPTRGNAT